MAQWQTADAKQQFTQLVAAAREAGPQLVMRHKEPVAVVLSAEDYRRLVRQADANFARILSSSPMEPEELGGMSADLTGDDEPAPAPERRAVGFGD